MQLPKLEGQVHKLKRKYVRLTNIHRLPELVDKSQWARWSVSFSISVTISADEVFAKDRSVSPVATTLPYDLRNSARNAIGSGFDGVIVQRHLIFPKKHYASFATAQWPCGKPPPLPLEQDFCDKFAPLPFNNVTRPRKVPKTRADLWLPLCRHKWPRTCSPGSTAPYTGWDSFEYEN